MPEYLGCHRAVYCRIVQCYRTLVSGDIRRLGVDRIFLKIQPDVLFNLFCLTKQAVFNRHLPTPRIQKNTIEIF